MEPRPKAYLQIHTAVILFGLTGILGDLILISKPSIVWWRMFLTPLSLMLIPGMLASLRGIPKKEMASLFGIGGLVAIHWVAFFSAIALTNVSVTLACMASSSFFTSLLEPLLLKKKFQWYEALLGVLVVPGVALIYSSTDFAFSGIMVALFAAFLASVFGVLNKKVVEKHDPIAITFIELGSGWMLLCLLLPLYYYFNPEMTFIPQGMDFVYLGILAFLCTSFAYVIALRALKVLSSFSVSLTINLEPVYTILLAIPLLGEHKELNWGFYVGALIIIGTVFIHPMLDQKSKKRQKFDA